jgi:hypothetical protein
LSSATRILNSSPYLLSVHWDLLCKTQESLTSEQSRDTQQLGTSFAEVNQPDQQPLEGIFTEHCTLLHLFIPAPSHITFLQNSATHAKMASYKVAAPDEYLAITGMGIKNGELSQA